MDHSARAEFHHVHRAGDPGKPTLLLLHGTGGNEHDLVPLGERVMPGAAILSPRGQVLEHGMPRFFRRISEGVFDIGDLKMRAASLAAWIGTAVNDADEADTTEADSASVVALGFSNGANMAGAILLGHPGVLAGAVLLRAMVPYEPEAPPVLDGVPVLISAGRADPIVPATQVERLAAILRSGGADVTVEWQDAGHGLVQGDLDSAATFLSTRFSELR